VKAEAPLYVPPLLSDGRAREIAHELQRIRGLLADVRHNLETWESGRTDDPAQLAGACVHTAEVEVGSAIRWLTN
jgi:hypothetical protein